MKYFDHPLLEFSEAGHSVKQPAGDQTPEGIDDISHVNLVDRFKCYVGSHIYPIRSKIMKASALRLLKGLSKSADSQSAAENIAFGHKGFGKEIFLKRIRQAMIKDPEVVLCYGCGMGDELLTVAQCFKPKQIIGMDYFNYDRYWKLIAAKLKETLNVRAEFRQISTAELDMVLYQKVDLIYSHSVLEHLRDMDEIFSKLKNVLKPGGYFSAQWGPMWYSYSGDHISGELGLEKGFEHLYLPEEEYLQFYMTHPRNKADVRDGVPTWLELGLHNFATYDEYISSLQKYFGDIKFLQWVLSAEALQYKRKFSSKWSAILNRNSSIKELDMVLQCAGVLLN